MGTSTQPVPPRLGPYELLQRIATGGMAEVYLARRAGPHGFQKIVAVKRILPQLARDPDFTAMFVDEARVCARLGHPNIVQVFDFGEHNGELYMAMEYVDGTTGAKLIRAAAAQEDEIPLDVCLHIALSVLRGLEYAHNARDEEGRPLSLVHRDVSPGNVLIDRSGAVKLTDFGIARATEVEPRTEAGQLKGKLGYMSPEQVVGRQLDARSDLFTLGIVLAELVMLRPLFAGGSELDVLMRIRDADLTALDRSASRIPDDVKPVLYRALAKDPLLRYPTAAAFAEAIEEVVRRRRLQVGPAKLATWVEKLGLIGNEGFELEEDTDEVVSTAVLELGGDAREALGSMRPSAHPSERDVSPQIYRIQQPDGAVLGPMSYPRLVELFATGRVKTKALIARESAEYRLAQDYSELQRFVTSPALRWDTDFPADATGVGPLDRVLLPSRIFQLVVRRETGMLLLKDGDRKKKIYIVEGVPEFVASTDKHELLGEQLVARGQVLRMEVDMALAMLPRFGGRIGDALVGLGVLRPIELFRAIHEQTQARFAEIFRWRTGEFGFVRGARSHEETFPMGVDPYELIARGVREGYSAEELEAILSPLDEEVLEPVVPLPVRIETFRLPEREANVLREIDGKSTLRRVSAEMSDKQKADPGEVLRAVFLGLSCEVLRSHRWTIFTSTPPGARNSSL
ncbi:MAG TPA: serine/threonine-protein kinase [Polyangiaceae bacterium]|jgi:serine/threonine-protein kinase